MDTFIFVIGKTNSSVIEENLKIDDVYDVRDRTYKRLILSKLMLNNNKLLVESNFLKVIDIDLKKNKLILELDDETYKLFRTLDNKCIELLGNLLEDEKMNNMEIVMDGDLTFVPLVSDDNSSNILRLCLDNKTSLKYNKSNISLEQVKVGDMFRFLSEIESINLYPSELICHTKQYCHMGEIYRTNIHKLNKRTSINNYTFSTDAENVFKKVVLEDQDISLIKTEKEPDNQQKHFIISKEEEITEDSLSDVKETNEVSQSETSNSDNNYQYNLVANLSEESEKIYIVETPDQAENSEHEKNSNLNKEEINNEINNESDNSEVNNNQDDDETSSEEKIIEEPIIKPKRKYTKRVNVENTKKNNAKNNTKTTRKKIF